MPEDYQDDHITDLLFVVILILLALITVPLGFELLSEVTRYIVG